MRAGTNRPSRTAILAAVALVGSLLAMPGPVGGVEGEADDTAQYSACLGPATESAGFIDMVGAFAEEAVNCLAHYGIAKGTSATMFSPNAPIKRLQMALFLSRAAGPAGITLPVVRDQGFTDIAGMNSEIQAAINQMAQLGVMEGRSGTEFRPEENVTREDMAVHLAAFLEEAVIGPGGIDIEDVEPDDEDVFEDIDRLSRRSWDAILNLYEMGITEGTSRSRFTPAGAVTRAQMALFITRTLAHTNARPAGLTVQVFEGSTRVFEGDTIELVASVRDDNHRPVEDAYVDFFWGDSVSKALDSSGQCVTAETNFLDIGGDLCEIDSDDPFTNSEGNLEDSPTTIPDDDLVIWGWTGDFGDTFDADRSDPVRIHIGVIPGADNTRLTYNAGVTNTVKFGKKVTFTFQLIDDKGARIRKPDAKVTVRMTVDKFDGHDETITSERFDRDIDTDTYRTDSSGRFEISHTERDQKRGTDNVTTMELVFSDADYPVVDDDGDSVDEITVKWSDEPAGVGRIIIDDGDPYSVASNNGRNSITVTLTDQYGSPFRGEVTFTSDDSNSVLRGNSPRRVNSRGVLTFIYDRDTTTQGVEMITVSYDGTPSIDDAIQQHYWGTRPEDGDSFAGTVVHVDKADNVMVLNDSGTIHIVKYRNGDQYRVDGTAKVFSVFECNLTESDTIGSGSEYGDKISVIILTDVDNTSCPDN